MQLKNCLPKSAPALSMVCSRTVELSHLFEKCPWVEGQLRILLRNWLKKRLRINPINLIKNPYQNVKIWNLSTVGHILAELGSLLHANCKWKSRIYWTVLSKLSSSRPSVPKPRPPLAWSNRHESQQYLPSWHAWLQTEWLAERCSSERSCRRGESPSG